MHAGRSSSGERGTAGMAQIWEHDRKSGTGATLKRPRSGGTKLILRVLKEFCVEFDAVNKWLKEAHRTPGICERGS